jgi:hypothetical protein
MEVDVRVIQGAAVSDVAQKQAVSANAIVRMSLSRDFSET